MEGKTTLPIPQYLENLAKNYFGDSQVLASKEILARSCVNISFFKGTPENYFICSGIVRDYERYEVKVVFKKRGGKLLSIQPANVWIGPRRGIVPMLVPFS